MFDPEVIYAPYKQIVIHDIYKYDNLDQLVRTSFTTAKEGEKRYLRWVDGIAFDYSIFPLTDSNVREQMAGSFHMSHLYFTHAPKCEQQILVNKIVVSMADVSYSSLFRSVARFLKNR